MRVRRLLPYLALPLLLCGSGAASAISAEGVWEKLADGPFTYGRTTYNPTSFPSQTLKQAGLSTAARTAAANGGVLLTGTRGLTPYPGNALKVAVGETVLLTPTTMAGPVTALARLVPLAMYASLAYAIYQAANIRYDPQAQALGYWVKDVIDKVGTCNSLSGSHPNFSLGACLALADSEARTNYPNVAY